MKSDKPINIRFDDKMDDENMDGDIELTLFVFYAIIIPIIAIFGFIGNLFSIYIIIR